MPKMTFSSPSKDVFDLVQYSEDLPEEFLCNVWYELHNTVPMDKYTASCSLRALLKCRGINSLITNLFYSKGPVLDAHLAAPCCHTFWGFCLEEFRNATGIIACAKCREPWVNFFHNIFTNNLLSNFKEQWRSCSEKFDLDRSKYNV